MKRHKQLYWDVEEKRRKRDASIQKEKERLKELERQKERENLKRKAKRKGRTPKALKSSPAKIIMTGEWPSVPSTSCKTPPPHPSPDTGDSTESSSHTQSQYSQDTDDYTSKSPESNTEQHIE